jgi:hypothetical protein
LGQTKRHVQVQRGVSTYPASSPAVLCITSPVALHGNVPPRFCCDLYSAGLLFSARWRFFLQKFLLPTSDCWRFLNSAPASLFKLELILLEEIGMFRPLFKPDPAVNCLYSSSRVSARPFVWFFNPVMCPFNGELSFHISTFTVRRTWYVLKAYQRIVGKRTRFLSYLPIRRFYCFFLPILRTETLLSVVYV